MKIKELLNDYKDVPMHLKEMVISHLLSIKKSELLLDDNIIKPNVIEEYHNIIKEIKTGKPIQYILETAYFYNNEFYVNNSVLIPRVETEYLIKETYDLINKYFKDKAVKILDIGTGSGNIAITLKELLPRAIVTATDISTKALEVAKINTKKLNQDITLKESNLFDNINETFDVIISNPPYIKETSKTVEENVNKYEPHLALYAKNNGLYYLEEILKEAPKYLNKPSIIAFETGEEQKEELKDITYKYFSKAKIITKQDLNNYERYFFVINE